jgi:hypothetical protein
VDYSYLETLYGARGAVCARGDVEFLSWRWQCCSRMLSFSVYFSLFMFSWAGAYKAGIGHGRVRN